MKPNDLRAQYHFVVCAPDPQGLGRGFKVAFESPLLRDQRTSLFLPVIGDELWASVDPDAGQNHHHDRCRRQCCRP